MYGRRAGRGLHCWQAHTSVGANILKVHHNELQPLASTQRQKLEALLQASVLINLQTRHLPHGVEVVVDVSGATLHCAALVTHGYLRGCP